MKKIHLFTFITMFFVCKGVMSQGYFTGDLELRSDYFFRDTTIGASGTNHYDDLKSSVDTWLSVNYFNNDIGFAAGIRLDAFLNSRLHNPNQDAFNAIGIGRWYVRKSFNDIEITGGYFYDQFGSGIAFRAYEDRFLGIDNAILGVHVKYSILEHFVVKGFAGVRKNRLSMYKPLVKGLNGEGFVSLGEKTTLIPGASIVNRTIDESSMGLIASQINSYDLENRFIPKYNTYIFSAYNTLNIGNFSWFIEGAYKTKEAVILSIDNPLQNKAGSIVYTNLTYTQKGFGITAQFKRTSFFQVRTSPFDNQTILNGALNFIPPTNRMNSLRLPARYSPASQEIEEVAGSLDITYTPKKGYTFNASYSEIHSLDVSFKHWAKTTLFREFYLDLEWRANRNVKGMVGVQHVQYNRLFYEGKKPTDVLAYAPFAEITVKLDRKKSIRIEAQYQHAEKDFGQWLYGLVEYNMAPHFSISVSDMWNFSPGPNESSKKEHYYSVFASYTQKQHRFYVSYVRQVEGIVCTGGVCRLEPAFNGFRTGLTTSF